MPPTKNPILQASEITFGFTPGTTFLQPTTLSICKGSFYALLGPNGAGKSTLLRLLAGLIRPHTGQVLLDNHDLRSVKPTIRAQQIAFLPQKPAAPTNATAQQIVLLGRFPHRSFHLFESTDDLATAQTAMQTTKTQGLSDRTMGTLSGGEAQRVHLAAALAQQPKIMLLDEPTSDLDMHHQLDVFHLLRDLAHKQDLAIIAVTHDLNMAAQYCDQILLLQNGRLVANGSPDETLVPEVLTQTYDVRFDLVSTEGSSRPWLLPSRLDIQTGGPEQ